MFRQACGRLRLMYQCRKARIRVMLGKDHRFLQQWEVFRLEQQPVVQMS